MPKTTPPKPVSGNPNHVPDADRPSDAVIAFILNYSKSLEVKKKTDGSAIFINRN